MNVIHRGISRMKRLPSLLTVCLLCLGPLSASAEVIVVDRDGERVVRVRTDATVPGRGMTKEAVESAFGEPNRRVSAIGDPPISRWEYDGFTVYFENDHVLHTVIISS